MSDFHRHNNSNPSNKKQDDELDSFLTTIESKLRGPFSSLDLAKAVSTAALRSSTTSAGNLSVVKTEDGNTAATNAAKEYLHNLLSVFHRTDKVIQCRMLIGLLGLTDNDHQQQLDGIKENTKSLSSSSLTPDILQILQETQSSGSVHEEWVRTVSGLIQGILFRDGTDNSRRSCRGEEAANIIDKQEKEVSTKLKQYLNHERTQHSHDGDSEGNEHNIGFNVSPDLNACFAPYRYSLVSTPVLKTIIPEFRTDDYVPATENGNDNETTTNQNLGNNCHFHVNTTADILQVDWKLEEERAKEEEQHGGTGTAGLAGIAGNTKDLTGNIVDPTSGVANLPPGFRPTKLVRSPKSGPGALKASSSMFMPKSKSSSMFNTNASKAGAAKTLLRRKHGGAQALVKGSSMKQRIAAATTAGGRSAIAGSITNGSLATKTSTIASRGGVSRFTSANKGRSAAMASGRSKMKMIDVNEVSELNKQHQQQQQQAGDDSRASKRKRILGAAQRGQSSSETTKKVKNNNGQAVSSTTATKTVPKPASSPIEAPSKVVVHEEKLSPQPPPPQPKEDWEIQFGLPGTNKMGDSDKERARDFFDKKPNPTPSQPVYKMKVHDTQGQHPDTGNKARIMTYLELNYSTGTHKTYSKYKEL